MSRKLLAICLSSGALLVGALAPSHANDFWCKQGAKPCGPGFKECKRECKKRTGSDSYCYNEFGHKGKVKCW